MKTVNHPVRSNHLNIKTMPASNTKKAQNTPQMKPKIGYDPNLVVNTGKKVITPGSNTNGGQPLIVNQYSLQPTSKVSPRIGSKI